MSDRAEFEHPISDVIRKRWSPRAFADQSVSEADIRTLLEAARWAPSCFNEQPWSFLIASREDQAGFEKMLACLVDGNQVWAKAAPVLMISLASKQFRRNDKPNRFAYHDVGLAVGQMGLQAMEMGLYMHQMGGIHHDKIREAYQLPDSVDPVAGIALGYLGNAASLPEDLAERETAPRSRRASHEFAFKGNYGDAF